MKLSIALLALAPWLAALAPWLAPAYAQTPPGEPNPTTTLGVAEPGAPEVVLQAAPLEGEVRVDGILDEPVWSAAPAVVDFRQQEPDEGRPATYATQVRVAFSTTHLYIAARMDDPEPERLIARIFERDGVLEPFGFGQVGSSDDALFVVLDTYDDGRNGFLFGTNPNGAEGDGLLRGEGNLNVSWDAVWRVAAALDPAGWSAEFEIPFWTLRFAEGDERRWGINFQRIIRRRNETVLWRSWTRDNGGLLKVSQAGSLAGLAKLDQGLNLQLKPFVLAEGRRERSLDGDGLLGPNEGAVDGGLDAKFGVTPNLTLDATVNTDFAQVEADVRQINLTRFNLFFPEKREFFLEGAGIFDFGVPGFGGPPPLLAFFSRRIGLEQGREVPILGGLKLTGKEGPYTVGVLDVVTGEKEFARRTNFGVARVIREVGERSSVGAIATHRATSGSPGSSAFGVDTHVGFSQEMVFDAFITGTDTPEARGETAAYRAALDFTADTWGWLVDQTYVGPGFEPPLGFVLRDDINRQFGTFRVSPRPPALGLRRVDFRINTTFVSSADWEIRDRNYEFRVTPQFDSGDGLELAVSRGFERLTAPFALREEIVFEPADYRATNVSGNIFTSENRPLSGSLFAGDFGFLSGRNRVFQAEARLAVGRKLSFEGSWNHNDIRTPDGDLTTDLAVLRVNYAFSTHLFTNALVQYDSETNEIDANVRVNLIHSPGSDLFVVLNERRGETGDGLELRNRALVVKFTKLFNL